MKLDELLQWGRAVGRGKSRESIAHARTLPVASMGPRRGARKISSNKRNSSPSSATLQWGRAVGRGKSRRHRCHGQGPAPGFNGAAPWGAENQVIHQHGGEAGSDASMGPRRGARKIFLVERVLRCACVASMGPRRGARKIEVGDFEADAGAELQWGRAVGRGKSRPRRSCATSACQLQWGRAVGRGKSSAKRRLNN